jgi:hypothetical protein
MKFDREAFVDECRRALAEDAQQLAVREVVERAVRDPAGVESEFGVADGWRIDVLYNDEDLTIMHFVWPPLVDLFPHEHKMWSTVGIYGGVEDNTHYRRAGHSIEVNGRKRGEVGDVLLLGSSAPRLLGSSAPTEFTPCGTPPDNGPRQSTSTAATSSPTLGRSGT